MLKIILNFNNLTYKV